MNRFTLSASAERKLFYAVLLLTTLFLFYPPYLPMSDLPQHAAQVAVLDDLLKQQSPWADLVVLNWDTPYLAGYSLWWLLYQFTDIVTSSKILVTLTLLFYCWAIHLLRKSFCAPAILEWAALTGFFGFAFLWGFITFLLAIPIGILFFLANKRWLETGRLRYFAALFLLGCSTYFAHILIFSFFCFISYSYFLTIHFREQNWLQRLLFTLPYLFFAFLLFRYINKPELTVFRDYESDYIFVPIWYKPLALVYMPWNMGRGVWFSIAWLALLMLPRRMGYQATKKINRYVPLIGFLIVWSALPHGLYQTAFIFERFAVFFMPFYYLIWEKQTDESQSLKKVVSQLLFAVVIAGLMFKVYYNNVQFSRDPIMKDYLAVLDKMQPEKRVLTLFDTPSPSSGLLTSNTEYLQFGAWYQAQKRGWTDFNFAAFHPQIVRYKPEKIPNVGSRSGSSTQEGIARIDNCSDYDYLLMNTTKNPDTLIAWLNENPSCKPLQLVEQKHTWLLFAQKGKSNNG